MQKRAVKAKTDEKAFIEKVLFINRTTKVTKGGKNLSFSALVVVGDGINQAGFAVGKANEV
ncbi:MAG: 30S ribosomal protein S5, partial [Candidatus Omnitrophica bacterium]|nr:30S ribosomal protein S5 [Candidatus Omnitrophota bacterium]